MKKKNQKQIGQKVIGMVLLFLLFSSSAKALCLQDCLKTDSAAPSFSTVPTQIRNSDSYNRENSHDVRDTKNSIVGDVYIRNGHEKLEISNIQSKETMIDASVTAVINLGDMTQ